MSDHDVVEEDDTMPSSSTDSDVEAAEAAVSADLAALQQERDEMRALAQRLQADFENYKKRMLREQTTAIERANARLLESLFPVLESFELAAKSIEALEHREQRLEEPRVGALDRGRLLAQQDRKSVV